MGQHTTNRSWSPLHCRGVATYRLNDGQTPANLSMGITERPTPASRDGAATTVMVLIMYLHDGTITLPVSCDLVAEEEA